MSVRQPNQVGYGLSAPLLDVPLMPIIANRAPSSNDMAALGTIWVYKAQNLAYILTSVVNNVADWVLVTQSAGDFVQYTVQTTDGVATALAQFPMAASSSLNIAGNIIATKSDYSEGLGGTFSGSLRRGAAGQPQLIGAPVIQFVEDSAGNPTVDIVVAGNTAVLQVTGVAASIWNWKAEVTTIVQPPV